METAFKDYLLFLDKLTGILVQLADIEKERCSAVRKDDLLCVDDCTKREQAISLSLRGMDRQREKMLESMGLKNVTLSQLPDHSPPELWNETRDTVEKLQRQLGIYQSAAKTARCMMEINLHEIEKHMGGDAAPQSVNANPIADIRA